MEEPINVAALSFFKPLGYQSNNCGYCKRKNSSPSYFASSSRVKPDHYQDLADRGWRRSGTIFYKPDLPRSCCPHYTIRLRADQFKPRKDQRKAVNRWNNFVLGQEYIQKASRLCPQTKEEKRRRKNTFDLKTEVHRAEYSNLKRPIDPQTKKPIEPAHKFEVTIESDSFSGAKWELFRQYQLAVHKEPESKNTKKTFERFLCSGLRRSTVKEDGRDKRLGSYHQCYRLDGKLIAIGVLDLMPQGVSAVYILYDPKFEEYEFGKLTALREISLALEEGYQYYYMGYYIHSCVKMKYKANFRPQQILDPESLEWNDLDDSTLKQLDKTPYFSPSAAKKAGKVLDSNDDTIEPLQETKSEVNQQPNANVNVDGNEDDDEEPLIPEGSLFDLNVPGVLTSEEVEKNFDLDHWKLMIEGQFIELEDIRGWESQSIRDPQSLKGIAGELVAALGLKVAAESVMMFE